MYKYIKASDDNSILMDLKNALMSFVESLGFSTKLVKATLTGKYYEIGLYAISNDGFRCYIYILGTVITHILSLITRPTEMQPLSGTQYYSIMGAKQGLTVWRMRLIISNPG